MTVNTHTVALYKTRAQFLREPAGHCWTTANAHQISVSQQLHQSTQRPANKPPDLGNSTRETASLQPFTSTTAYIQKLHHGKPPRLKYNNFNKKKVPYFMENKSHDYKLNWGKTALRERKNEKIQISYISVRSNVKYSK